MYLYNIMGNNKLKLKLKPWSERFWINLLSKERQNPFLTYKVSSNPQSTMCVQFNYKQASLLGSACKISLIKAFGIS